LPTDDRRTALFWAITMHVVIPYRRFGTTSRSHLQESPLKMGRIGCPETSAENYHYMLRNSPEEGSSHLLRRGSLNSRNGRHMAGVKVANVAQADGCPSDVEACRCVKMFLTLLRRLVVLYDSRLYGRLLFPVLYNFGVS